MIRATDRVAAVLARDERLIETFTALSPAFERLRSPWMRKTMSRLVTVEQAARMAGIDAAVLVDRLNRALSGAGDEREPDRGGRKMADRDAVAVGPGGDRPRTSAPGTDPPGASDPGAPLPTALAAVPAERIVDVDVREALRRGEEPFSTIMAARRSVPPGGVLRVRAIFEPVPLYAVMGKQGLDHWTERFGEEDWRVWFYPAAEGAGAGAAADAAAEAGPVPGGPAGDAGATAPGGSDTSAGGEPSAGTPAASDAGEDVVVLDVRGLEPPEPMVRTLEALEELPAGKTLVQLNVRVPRFLLPQLEARGFAYEIREQSRDLVRVFIRRAGGH